MRDNSYESRRYGFYQPRSKANEKKRACCDERRKREGRKEQTYHQCKECEDKKENG